MVAGSLLRSGVLTQSQSKLRWNAAVAALFLVTSALGCAGTSAPAARSAPAAANPTTVGASAAASKAVWDHSQARLPVTSADPIWGEPDAPVTIVTFMDLQCPFCGRVTSTLEQIKQKYGAGKVRLVFLHNPLPFHDRAYAAAVAASTVRELSGSDAFFEFVELALSNQSDLTDENFVTWAGMAGTEPRAFREAIAAQKLRAKVDADMALARSIGAHGTPEFRINGVTLSGAQSLDKFEQIIEQQIAEAVKLRLGGAHPLDTYVALTNRNLELSAPAGEPAKDPEDDVVWRIPVNSDDPTRGPADAAVTIVEFCEFECPYCRKVQDTLSKIRERYRDDVRIVWKDHPLPFHDQAMPAAVLARLVLERRGNAAFFSIHDRLFEGNAELSEDTLIRLAKEYSIAWPEVQRALEKSRSRSRIEASSDLAAEFRVSGTPNFFINGVRLRGAQPFEKFEVAVDAQLTKAKALLAKGVAKDRLYRETIAAGSEAPALERKQAPTPAAGRPVLGPASAPVLIQQWSDFECSFCNRVQPTLAQLRRDFPNEIRIAWRHLPLPFHPQAPVAAEISEEVLVQKGQAAFWKFHDRVFELQGQDDGLSEANLTKAALSLGVDEARLRESLNAHRHRGVIDADGKAAESLDISGTPAFVINGYHISGAQPVGVFRNAIRRALADQRRNQRQ